MNRRNLKRIGLLALAAILLCAGILVGMAEAVNGSPGHGTETYFTARIVAKPASVTYGDVLSVAENIKVEITVFSPELPEKGDVLEDTSGYNLILATSDADVQISGDNASFSIVGNSDGKADFTWSVQKDNTVFTPNDNGISIPINARQATLKPVVEGGVSEFAWNAPAELSYALEGLVNEDNPSIAVNVGYYDGEKKVEAVDLAQYVDADLSVKASVENNDPRYEILLSEEVVTVKVVRAETGVTWTDHEAECYYNGKNHAPTASATAAGVDVVVTLALNGQPESEAVAVGDHTATVELTQEASELYVFAQDAVTTRTFTVKPLPVTVLPVEGQSKYYSTDDPQLLYTLSVSEQTGTSLADIEAEFRESFTLLREDGEDVGEYAYTLDGEQGSTNFVVTLQPAEGNAFSIKPLPVTVLPVEGQSKYYGTDDPQLLYTLSVSEQTGASLADIEAEFRESFTLLREDGEDVGEYAYTLDGKQGPMSFAVTLQFAEGNVFSIKPLPVTVAPVAGQSKVYAAEDPASFAYTVTVGKTEDGEEIALADGKLETIPAELGQNVLVRNEGQNLGVYAYALAEVLNTNYVVSLDAADEQGESVGFAITAGREVADLPEAITSRTFEFAGSVVTGEGETLDPDAPMYLRVEAKLSEAGKAFGYGRQLADYLSLAQAPENAVQLVPTQENAFTVAIAPQTLSEGGEGGRAWSGGFPAGTELTLTPVDGNGEAVGKAHVLIVEKAQGFITLAQKETLDAIDLSGFAGEPINIEFNVEMAEDAPVYEPLTAVFGADGSYTIPEEQLKPYNRAFAHLEQNLAVGYLDAENMLLGQEDPQTVTLAFVYDDIAFQIPSDDIFFENRATELKITLPEPGVVTNVSIGGASYGAGAMSDDGVTCTVMIDWKNAGSLIASGTSISVSYQDRAGNSVDSTGSVRRYTVATPIVLRLRPEVNSADYLSGDRARPGLTLYGTACAGEALRVTIGGYSDTVVVECAELWADEKGNWNMTFNTSRLPEGDVIRITVSYVDVNGRGAETALIYDADCEKTVLMTPIYEGMTAISGVVEPNSAAWLIIGDNAYELPVDLYGYFYMEDVPSLLQGESFRIRVIDIAGNSEEREYTVPSVYTVNEAGEETLGSIATKLYPLGAIFYDSETGFWANATPVDIAQLVENGGEMRLPLLAGEAYLVGEVTVRKVDGGVVVTSETTGLEQSAYTVTAQSLQAYSDRPSVNDLRDHAGVNYSYGQTIPAGEEDVIWICAETQIELSDPYALAMLECVNIEDDELYSSAYYDFQSRK